MLSEIQKTDKKLYKILGNEMKRQKNTLNLIASENIAPKGVLKILGSNLTNKYCEGYPCHRYYSGCKEYDKIEEVTKERALRIFGLKKNKWDINVQAYSGAIANLAILLALLKPGDSILSMQLDAGGHLSHGSKASFTGKLFNVLHYGVDKNYNIDYKKIECLAKKHKPKIIISGASAYPKKIDFKKIGEIAKKIEAYHLSDISHYAGLISTKKYPSPFAYADIIMTTTHKSLMGPRGALIYMNKKLTTAKNQNIYLQKIIDKAVFPGLQGGPHFNNIGAMAYGLNIVLKPTYKTYIKNVLENSKTLLSELKKFKYKIVGKKTDSHMFLVNTFENGISGDIAEKLLEKIGILSNRNMIYKDKNPNKPSAIRIGTYSVSLLGMHKKEMTEIAEIIHETLSNKKPTEKIRKRVILLAKKFPINGRKSFLTSLL